MGRGYWSAVGSHISLVVGSYDRSVVQFSCSRIILISVGVWCKVHTNSLSRSVNEYNYSLFGALVFFECSRNQPDWCRSDGWGGVRLSYVVVWCNYRLTPVRLGEWISWSNRPVRTCTVLAFKSNGSSQTVCYDSVWLRLPETGLIDHWYSSIFSHFFVAYEQGYCFSFHAASKPVAFHWNRRKCFFSLSNCTN